MRWRAVAVLAGASVACTLEYAPPDARARAAAEADTLPVLAELQDYYRDLSARDWPAFSEHFWPDATITTRWQPPDEDSVRVWATTVPGFVAAAAQGPDSREVFEERMLTARITVRGELAQAWVTYRARFGDPAAIAEWEGLDAFTLLRHGGRWRIVSLAFAQADGGS